MALIDSRLLDCIFLSLGTNNDIHIDGVAGCLMSNFLDCHLHGQYWWCPRLTAHFNSRPTMKKTGWDRIVSLIQYVTRDSIQVSALLTVQIVGPYVDIHGPKNVPSTLLLAMWLVATIRTFNKRKRVPYPNQIVSTTRYEFTTMILDKKAEKVRRTITLDGVD